VRARRSGRHRQRLDRIELVGDLGSKIDRAGRTTEYEYDEAGRVKRILQSPSALTDFEATFRYDILGNLVEADNGTARIVYLRDGWGRVTREDLLIDGDNCSTSYGYDKVGNVQYIVYPDATNVSYAYDAFDRPTDVYMLGQKHATLTYRRDDLVESIGHRNFGSAILYSQFFVYDDQGRLLRTRVSRGTTNYLDLRYNWTFASDVRWIVDAVAGKTDTYAHDGQGRLAQAMGPWGSNGASLTLTYTYDAKGNWLTKKEGATTSYYVYDASKKDDRLCGVDTTSGRTCASAAARFEYNAVGERSRRLAGSTTTYAFDMDGLLQKVGVTSGNKQYGYAFLYDALGRRVRSTEPSGSSTLTTYYMYGGGNVLFTYAGTSPSTMAYTLYVYAAGLLVFRMSPWAVKFYHQDHLGNVRLVTYWDRNAVKTDFAARYKPFGEIVTSSAADPKFKYTGEWLTSVQDGTGLYYLRARYYDPSVGRFLSQDPILGSLFVPQSLNRYAYVVNNPLKYTDPTGEGWFLAIIPLLAIVGILFVGTSDFGSEDFWTGLSVIPGVDSIGDAALATKYCGEWLLDGRGDRWGDCLAGAGFAAMPVIGFGMVKLGGRVIGSVPWNHLDDVPGVPTKGRVAVVGGVPTKGAPDDFVVVRGGTGDIPPPGVKFSGTGGTVWDAARWSPYGKIRITTASRIRALGGTVDFTPGTTPSGAINPAHVDIVLGPGGSPFGPLVRNPIPRFLRPG